MKRAMMTAMVTALVLASASGIVLATPITVANYSFEATVVADGSFSSPGVSGWTSTIATIHAAGVFNPLDATFPGTTGSPGTIPGTGHGTQVCYMSRIPSSATLYQNPSSYIIEADNIYTLTTAVGQRLDSAFFPANGFQIKLTANAYNGTVLASTAVMPDMVPKGTFTDFTISFNSALIPSSVGQSLFIVYGPPNGTADFQQAMLDNVRLDSALIPEPVTMSLLALGGLAIVFKRRRCA